MALLGIALVLLFDIGLAAPSSGFHERCRSFDPTYYVENSTLNVREFVAAGSNLTFPDNVASCGRASQVVSVDLCRVALEIRTSSTSRITFEMWFPEEWSGRFLATGNGGLDGCIKYEDIAYGTQNGFATVGANNGHNGTSGRDFFNEHEMVVDFAWRSLHTSVETGKMLAQRFYQKKHRTSYYIGCSLGGRQGIKAAEQFPRDFDGILVGAPGVDFNNLYSWRALFYTITGPKTSPNFIPPQAWKTWIHDEVLRQCDGIDGAKDGIIEDPLLCRFNPRTLKCNSANATIEAKCLNENQVQQLVRIFNPYTYPSGELIFPGMQPGSEMQAPDRLYTGEPFAYSEDWFKYVVYNDPSWNASTFTVADARAAEALNPANIRTYPSSLPAFESRGGKLLMYHGQQDSQLTSFNTNRFYEHLRGSNSKRGKRSYASMNTWVRFFRISGMFHCSGGPGAWALGQGGRAAQAGIPFDAHHNLLAALVAWVEKGAAPERVEGTKFVNDTVAAGVEFKRRHCMYPAKNVYVGGNYREAGSWRCK
ncbi:hypothetical protein COCSADRAFT_203908 [Bipolaris sorokiniana ND90Pr]|uniref:Carboxylic ester hydrolase n=1 Tax=Cochliobolus sativus (strain ND90Pr / ATCC 201652) TaxID=665912 RepID=M2SPW8_COCSN|nr:uncharacterized protein COCSADRAFT_203908 [Bipolaris sorokiniana ND90Pr]EMD58812.1 hypothetical protein COCSADRAFT_203908 [Bipolaris sorokiniana ND90Pr]